MGVLLDTHILLWWLADDDRLPSGMADLIANPATDVFVSAATAWEMSIKSALGKLTVPDGLPDMLADQGFVELPVDVVDALAAGRLPRHHDDPFDRMLIAQAMRRGLRLFSVDSRFPAYGVPIG